MWELDCEEGWALKNWCFWTVVLEKTLESPLDYKEIQPVRPKGDQSWVFFGRNDAKAETPVLWPPHAKSWLIGKDSDVGRDWGQEEKGTTQDEMTGWHHQLNAHEFEWTLGVGDGQGGLACGGWWGHKESDTTEWLNWTESCYYKIYLSVYIYLHGCFLVMRSQVNFGFSSFCLCLFSPEMLLPGLGEDTAEEVSYGRQGCTRWHSISFPTLRSPVENTKPWINISSTWRNVALLWDTLKHCSEIKHTT